MSPYLRFMYNLKHYIYSLVRYAVRENAEFYPQSFEQVFVILNCVLFYPIGGKARRKETTRKTKS
jgi:hypothetical protein